MGAPRQRGAGAQAVYGAGPATQSGYAIIVSRSCGESLVKRSFAVAVGPVQPPGKPDCQACITSFFLVDRRGHALIYFVWSVRGAARS